MSLHFILRETVNPFLVLVCLQSAEPFHVATTEEFLSCLHMQMPCTESDWMEFNNLHIASVLFLSRFADLFEWTHGWILWILLGFEILNPNLYDRNLSHHHNFIQLSSEKIEDTIEKKHRLKIFVFCQARPIVDSQKIPHSLQQCSRQQDTELCGDKMRMCHFKGRKFNAQMTRGWLWLYGKCQVSNGAKGRWIGSEMRFQLLKTVGSENNSSK